MGNGGGGGVVVRNSGVGAVEAGRAGRCGAAAVFIGGAKVSFEVGEGFSAVVFWRHSWQAVWKRPVSSMMV